jgi:hypothetical protein
LNESRAKRATRKRKTGTRLMATLTRSRIREESTRGFDGCGPRAGAAREH